MKLNRRWLLVILPLSLFAWAWQAASWRPKLVGAHPVNSGIGLKQIALGGGYSGRRLLVSPDGEHLASIGVDSKSSFVMLWNIAARKAEWRTDGSFSIGGINAFAFSPDGRTLAVSVDEGAFGRSNLVIYLVETATGKRRHLMKISPQTKLQDAAFLSDRELVIATSQDVSIVDAKTGVVKRQWRLKLPAPPNQQLFAFGKIRVSADGRTVLASSERTSKTVVAIYDSVTGGRRGKWFCPGISRLPRLSPNGTLWAMEQENSNLLDVYDARTGQKLWGPFARGNETNSWVWSADSQRILTTPGNLVAVIDARSGRDLGQLPGRANFQAMALSTDGNYFYSLDDNGKIWRWRAR